MRFLDLPPVYLLLCLCVAYWVGQIAPVPLGAALSWLGDLVFYAGLGLIAIAAIEFLRHRTTIIPRRDPSGLITSGIYRLTRNPIYLADVMILIGLTIRWEAVLALPLAPLFVWWITRHFILQEEQTLGKTFPEAYPDYLSRTRRWI